MNKSLSWSEVKELLKPRSIVEGVVLRHEQYGVFVDLGYSFEGLIQITDFRVTGRMNPDQYPNVGEGVRAVVLGFKETGKQIWLGVKPSMLALAEL